MAEIASFVLSNISLMFAVVSPKSSILITSGSTVKSPFAFSLIVALTAFNGVSISFAANVAEANVIIIKRKNIKRFTTVNFLLKAPAYMFTNLFNWLTCIPAPITHPHCLNNFT